MSETEEIKSELQPQDLEPHLEDLLKQIGEQNLVDWEEIQKSQSECMKGFEALTSMNLNLREKLQKNFLVNLREFKHFDAKDLIKRKQKNQIETSNLKPLLQFISKDQDGKLTLNLEQIKTQVKEKETHFYEINQTVTKKLFETAQWIDNFIKNSFENTSEKKTSQQKSQNQEEKKESLQLVQTNIDNSIKKFKFTFSEDKLSEIASKIKIEYIPNTLLIGLNTYTSIVEQSIYLSESEFIRVTLENRQQRRELMNQDNKKYLDLIMDHVQEIESLLIQSQEEICKQLGVSNEKLEKSELALMERGFAQHLLVLQATVREKVKERLPKKEVNISKTKEVIEYQIKLLNEKQDYFIPLIKELPRNYETAQMLPTLLNFMVNDFVCQEYNIEEEDYMHHLDEKTQSFNDKQMIELLKKIESGVMDLLQNSGFLPKQQQGMNQGFNNLMYPQGMGMPYMMPNMGLGYPNYPGYQ